MEDLLTVTQAAKELDIKPDSVRKLIQRNKLKATKLNGWYLIHRSEVERYKSQRLPAHRPPARPPKPKPGEG